jgi:hypothetical protein
MNVNDQLLRRRLIVIATGEYAALPSLDVGVEITAVRSWLTDPALADRVFSNAGDEEFADGPSFNDIRARFTRDGAFTDGDALVVYITGHGIVEGGRHYLALRESALGQIARTAVPTADLITWLASYKDMSNVFLVIDVCQAGAVTNDVTAELMRDLPRNWCVLATVPATVDAKVGAFTSVLREVLEDIREGRLEGVDEHRPYLQSSVLIGQIVQRLREQHGQKLMPLVDPYATTACMPNPAYDATKLERATASEERADLALLKSDLDPVWVARAPVVAAGGAVFTGRRAMLERLIGFVEGEPGALIVAGRAGSGKSAALARLVTCSDPGFRADYAEQLRTMSPLPAQGSVDVAMVATGKTPHQLAQRLATLLRAPVPTEDNLESYVGAIQTTLGGRARPTTVVVDALDEASDPLGVLLSVLTRIGELDRRRLRLIVGVRSSGGSASGESKELADLASTLLGGDRIDVDSDEVWEEADLRDYLAQVLAAGLDPSDDQRAIAQVVAERTGRSFLLAGLVAQELTSRAEDGHLAGSELEGVVDELASRGVRDLVVRDVESRYPDPEQRALALLLLRAAAVSFGRGIPSRDLWATVATAIAVPARRVSQADVDWFLRERSSGYLVRDVEDDEVVYRPFHDLLRSELQILGTEQSVKDVHSAVTVALLSSYVGGSRA